MKRSKAELVETFAQIQFIAHFRIFTNDKSHKQNDKHMENIMKFCLNVKKKFIQTIETNLKHIVPNKKLKNLKILIF